MELIDRFRYIMKINQLSASAFADEIGVQRSSVSHVLSGRNKPSLEFIQKVLKRYPKVDGNWLISGSTQIDKEKVVLDIEESSKAEALNSDKKKKILVRNLLQMTILDRSKGYWFFIMIILLRNTRLSVISPYDL